MTKHFRNIRGTDRPQPDVKSAFVRAKKAEKEYAKLLRRIAKHVGDIVREFPEGTIEAAALIAAALERYSKAIEPWAKAVGTRMVAEVAQRDEMAWKKVAATMGRALREEIATAPTGLAMRSILAEQISLITSLPTGAAQRVHEMTLKGISEGQRADQIAAVIMETGDVTMSRANLIARTEVARTASTLTQARALHIGSVGYIWRTAGDSDVRASHKKLNGQFVRWDTPPECDPGHHAHAGQIWNCRCYADVVLPE